MDFLNEEQIETGASSQANIISEIIMNYRRDRALARINEARAEYAAGLGREGGLEEFVKNF